MIKVLQKEIKSLKKLIDQLDIAFLKGQIPLDFYQERMDRYQKELWEADAKWWALITVSEEY